MSGAEKRAKRQERIELGEAAKISAHAHQRMREMGVTEGEVRSAIRYPVHVREAHRSGRPAHYYIGRRISVVLGEDSVVVTVLWSDREAGTYLQPERWRKGVVS